jgi:copper chaperone CopZ
MKTKFYVSGMTCTGCEASIEKSLSTINGVISVKASNASATVLVESSDNLELSQLQMVLNDKYKLSVVQASNTDVSSKESDKLQQLFPLFLILSYVFAASIALNMDDFFYQSFMVDFMGLFFIVFSFFKLLDLKGFITSFKMYDPLAKRIPIYALIYPFIEVTLGLLFLFRIGILFSLWMTVLVLGITTVGVTRSLLSKQDITCACLGSVLKLPMTLATFIENAIMILMAIIMLF